MVVIVLGCPGVWEQFYNSHSFKNCDFAESLSWNGEKKSQHGELKKGQHDVLGREIVRKIDEFSRFKLIQLVSIELSKLQGLLM